MTTDEKKKSPKRSDPLMVQSVAKAFRVLEAFDSRHPEMTLSDIAEQTGMDLSGAQRFAHTLETLGYLEKDGRTRQFRLSVKTLNLAHHFTRTSRLVDRAMPVLQHLSKETEETVNLTLLDGTEIVFISRFLSRHVLHTDVTIGTRLPAYCTAPGRAILSRLPAEEVAAILEASDIRAHTQNTETDIGKLTAIIEEARLKGYATALEELYHADASIAAPVLGSLGQVIGAVSLAVSTLRYSPEQLAMVFAPMILAAARSISFS
ncbi:IclR family transcriptional regulator [Salipiger abyssi]|uniref:IclR family transcriptional regulator n=1 Tax=Salipiger abyssi TaxID=1250539 RepID=UPI001A8EEA11|nr:IclR family transcriptional regulator C-terminal domain-containing protein [Salipiger abyssi]MBN9886934.1 helix-turn-helix domain-containing protein [Salipiger abyssi]